MYAANACVYTPEVAIGNSFANFKIDSKLIKIKTISLKNTRLACTRQKWPSRGVLQILKINSKLIKIKIISLKNTNEIPQV